MSCLLKLFLLNSRRLTHLLPSYLQCWIIAKSCTNELPVCLLSLYNSKYFDLPYHELLTECIKVYDSISVTDQQATSLEKITRKQSNSKIWFHHRAGGLLHRGLKLLHLQI